MLIKLESPINRYYVQTLCMIFFPGAKFGGNEEESEDNPSLYLKTVKNDTGITAYAEMSFMGKTCRSERSSPVL